VARDALTFKQQDVTRALRAAAAAGLEVRRIEIDKDGKIIVVTGKPKGAISDESSEDLRELI
jgi:hypothetical protein